MAKKEFDLLLSCNVDQTDAIAIKLSVDVLPTTECIYQIHNRYIKACTKIFKLRRGPADQTTNAPLLRMFAIKGQNCPITTKVTSG